jgi:DNA adenine methylase
MHKTDRRFPSPLRYPGGKGKLANYIKILLLQNDLSDVHYVEPYAGGASIALSLLFEEYARYIHINDLNRAIYGFWISVRDHTDELCRRIWETPVTVEERDHQLLVHGDPDASLTDLGFATFFLNRVNRSGIISAGVIGGKNQDGEWGMDARFNKPELVRRIEKIARYGHRIRLTNLDAAEFIQERVPALPDRTFVYLDPPYYGKGKNLYQHFYEHADHSAIAELVGDIRQQWVVSYDRHPRLVPLYSDYRSLEYGLNYSAQERYEGDEVIFFSPGLMIPHIAMPAKIPLRSVLEMEQSLSC